MNSNKSTLFVIALSIIGALFFSLIHIHPAVSFVVGVVATALILQLVFNSSSPAVTQDTPEDKPSSNTKTLYVGNLPYKANESDVRDLFAKYGEVFAVRLMKDKRTGKRRGFGFVVMAAEHSNHAIISLNDQDYMQRTLKVRIANDPKHPDEEMDEQA